MDVILSFIRKKFGQQGQSLAESALVLPIIVLLILGMVEIGNLLNTQNKVTTSARSATNLAARTFSGSDWTDSTEWADVMRDVALSNVSETLDIEADLWDIWTIKMTVSTTDTNSFSEWIEVHAYGNNAVRTELDPAVKTDILNELNNGPADPAGLEAVATVSYHDRASFLGLNAYNLGDFFTIRGLTVMRVDQPSPYVGCDLLPIAMRYEQYSSYPTNYTGPALSPEYPGDPYKLVGPPNAANIWPDANSSQEWDFIKPGSDYRVPNPQVFINPTTFLQNYPGVPLVDAYRGFIYYARLSEGEGNFGWLDWDAPPASQTDLGGSLTYPGDFRELYPGSTMDMGIMVDLPGGGQQISGNGDGTLEIGEWIYGSTGNVNSNEVRDQLQSIANSNRVVRIIVHDMVSPDGGSNMRFRVKGFVLVRMIGINFTGPNDKRKIGVEFIRWDDACSDPLDQ